MPLPKNVYRYSVCARTRERDIIKIVFRGLVITIGGFSIVVKSIKPFIRLTKKEEL